MGKSALDATQNCMQKIAPATHNLIQFCVCKRYFCCLVAFTYSKKCVCVFLWRITFELGIDGTAAGILLWCVVPSLYIYIIYITPPWSVFNHSFRPRKNPFFWFSYSIATYHRCRCKLSVETSLLQTRSAWLRARSGCSSPPS
jgi:hypothetical protein